MLSAKDAAIAASISASKEGLALLCPGVVEDEEDALVINVVGDDDDGTPFRTERAFAAMRPSIPPELLLPLTLLPGLRLSTLPES
jgi:hypothetical protein